LLNISDLSKTYSNGVRALNGVSLDLTPGLFGLLGPNGAGKSTLMRTIASLQKPDSGRILLDGVDVVSDPTAIRSRLGYLPQEFGVYPKIPAIDLLDYLAVLKGISNTTDRRDQIESLLELTNLWHVRKTAVSTFSGGMKQRFGIAQALLGNPRVVIVDEPTAGLDPEERNRFMNLLSEIGENVVIILSTHIVEDIRDLCPRMAILSDGKILVEGAPDNLIAKLEGRIWRRAISKDALDRYRNELSVISTHLHSGVTRIHVLADEAPEPGFEPVSPDLEDVYFSVLHESRKAA